MGSNNYGIMETIVIQALRKQSYWVYQSGEGLTACCHRAVSPGVSRGRSGEGD